MNGQKESFLRRLRLELEEGRLEAEDAVALIDATGYNIRIRLLAPDLEVGAGL